MSSIPDIKTSDSAALLQAFAQEAGDRPTAIDTAAAIYVAQADGISPAEAKILEDSFIKKLPSGQLRMKSGQLQEAQGDAALGYAGALLFMNKSGQHHLISLLKLMFNRAQSEEDVNRIVGVVERNRSLLKGALEWAENFDMFTSTQMQRAIHERLIALRPGHQYPYFPRGNDKDQMHGQSVPDPYRGLEKDSPAVREWIKAQTKKTETELNKPSGATEAIAKELMKGLSYPRNDTVSSGNSGGENSGVGDGDRMVVTRGDYIYTAFNDTGTRNHAMIYRQKGIWGPKELVLDPNSFSLNNNIALKSFNLSPDGQKAVVGLSKGGSDWEEFYVISMDSIPVKNFPPQTPPIYDHIKWISNTEITWKKDSKGGSEGFYYSRYDEPPNADLSAQKNNRKIYFHKLGTPQTADELVYFDPARAPGYPSLIATSDGRFEFITVYEGFKGVRGNFMTYRDTQKGDTAFTPLIKEATDFKYKLAGNVGSQVYFRTDRDAPNMQLVMIDLDKFDKNRPMYEQWSVVIPERKDGPLQLASVVNGKIFTQYLKDASTHVYVYDISGKNQKEIPLPGIGSATEFSARDGDEYIYYTYEDFTHPPAIYRLDTVTLKSEVLQESPKVPGFNPENYEVKQHIFTIKGVKGENIRVPMSIAIRKGTKLDGENPALLLGYGGFAYEGYTPYFSTTPFVLMSDQRKKPFVYVIVNLPGDGHEGKTSHELGRKGNKQNCFNALAQAALELIKMGYAKEGKIAVKGGSNGGLVAITTAMQNPELIRAAVGDAGLYDMARFHKRTVGRQWAGDYGSPDDAEDFTNLISYAPYSNVKGGQLYPNILLMAADHDDRVPPSESYKLAAALQNGADPKNVVLLRVAPNAAHGGGDTEENLKAKATWIQFLIQTIGQ